MTLQIAYSALPFLPAGPPALAQAPLSPEADTGFAQLLAARSVAPATSETPGALSPAEAAMGKLVAASLSAPKEMLKNDQHARGEFRDVDAPALSPTLPAPIQPDASQPEPATISTVEHRTLPPDRSENLAVRADLPIRESISPDEHIVHQQPANDKPLASPSPASALGLAGSVERTISNADMRKSADREAAPLAIAFVAAGIFELPAPDVDGLVTLSPLEPLHLPRGLDRAPSIQLSGRSAHQISHPLSPVVGGEMPTALLAPPRSFTRHMPVIAAGTASSKAPSSTADDAASVQSPPIDQWLTSVSGEPGASEPALAEPLNAEPRRNVGAHSQRSEFVASLLPVCVTLHAMGESVKLTVRMAANQSSDDPAEFERMAAKLLSSEGFDLRTVIMNGNQAHTARGNQR
ncbi:hypothetical protein [Sphingomonas colocasiae]|uniref:Flagellar hook-length control protein FliK n=1 Tax=Sphingomonas colocasiae TaxID=1848973 RepID=A0ABS7PW97_9SPHN|nr:hypothetical protein [Sphingomonas colocasiae]MBY8825561.1 hypothetical protein [Sphingomonas colocasiae]